MELLDDVQALRETLARVREWLLNLLGLLLYGPPMLLRMARRFG